MKSPSKNVFFVVLFNILFHIKRFFVLIGKSIGRMSLWERRLEVFFLLLLMILLGVKGWRYYKNQTVLVPQFGGTYSEAMVGEIKYINPILADNDVEEAVSRLLFSSLVRVESGNVTPQTAQGWEVSPDSLNYTFTLKDNVYFSDGQLLDADDVLYTVDQMKNPDLKSPNYEFWKDVEASSDAPNKVTFTLAKPYGPFILGCDFGILPDHVDDNSFAKKYTGSGPFVFDSVKKEGEKITEILLKSNGKYFDGKPYISKFKLSFYANKDDAKKAYNDKKMNGIFGVDDADGTKISYLSSRKLGLIFNLRDNKLKDKALRQKIVTGERLDPSMTLSLTVLDTPIQRSKAEEIKNRMKEQNIEVNLDFKNLLTIQEILKDKKYELLLYGFDFGHDMDPYPFWHSSQLTAANYAGFSDKKTDLLIESARQITDITARKAKYDEIYTALNNEYMAIYYEPINYVFVHSDELKGVSQPLGNDAGSRYDLVNKWYFNEKRARK